MVAIFKKGLIMMASYMRRHNLRSMATKDNTVKCFDVATFRILNGTIQRITAHGLNLTECEAAIMARKSTYLNFGDGLIFIVKPILKGC